MILKYSTLQITGMYFGIAFDKLFGQAELEVYNNFEMSSKRNFKNLSPLVLSTYEELFLDEGNLKEDAELILINLLRFKSEIMVSEEGVPYEKFVEFMDTIMDSGDKLLLNMIENFIEENYVPCLDKLTEETKNKKRKVNTELQFTDAHAKDILKATYLYRVMIPFISVYFFYNKGNFGPAQPTSLVDYMDPDESTELEFEEVYSRIFAYLFDKIIKNSDALRTKLYRLVHSGIARTSYSDKRFWRAAKNVAVTEKTEALEIYKKVLTNAVPKLSVDGNVINFLSSVINNQVDFLFQNKFKYHFTPIGDIDKSMSSVDDDDDNSMSEVERMEILATRKDEGAYLIRKLNMKEVLEDLPYKLNVGVSDAEVKDMMTKVTRNQIQEQIISLITFKFFQDKDALKYLSFYDYCYTLIICKKYLQEYKFIYLPQILTAKCEKHRERVSISGRKVKPEILSSKKYNDLIESKYTNFKDEVEKPFLAFIGTVYSSVFKDSNNEEIFDASVKVQKIAEEIIDLAALV